MWSLASSHGPLLMIGLSFSVRITIDRSAEPSLSKLSSLGHFLKGSSAALGIIKVQESCEKMQHYGNMRDEEAGESLSEEEALRRIQGLLADCQRDYQVAMAWMKKLYDEDEA
jgi:osomolarity two-component system phosphorelay intermediate protein YPD1